MDEQGILLMAFGKVSIEEPKKPTETVAPGGWRVPMGTLFETGESLAGLYVYDSRAAIRLGKQTVAAVERDRIALRGGRLWLSTLGEPVAQRIETEAVVVLSHGAELVVDHAADGVAVIVLDGGATVRAAGGDARHLASMQRCTIDRTGMIGEVKPVPFAGEYVGWMAPMILQQQDDRELYSWLDELVAAYVEGSYRDAAATVLRRFEARAVPRLFEVLDRFVDDPATLHRTAALIADLAQFPQREWLFAMLERGDEETRASAYRALVRVGGRKSAVRDEAFWRAAPASEREAESARWRELLR